MIIFRPITLRRTDDTIIKFYPEDIDKVILDKDIVTIYYFEDRHLDVNTKKCILKKENYYYLHWRYFINQLHTIFEIEGGE